MCDFIDDFENDNSFEDEYDEDTEMDDPLDGDSESDGELDKAEPQGQEDDFTAKDAFILGGAMGFAYEKGSRERKKRKLKRFSDDSD